MKNEAAPEAVTLLDFSDADLAVVLRIARYTPELSGLARVTREVLKDRAAGRSTFLVFESPFRLAFRNATLRLHDVLCEAALAGAPHSAKLFADAARMFETACRIEFAFGEEYW